MITASTSYPMRYKSAATTNQSADGSSTASESANFRAFLQNVLGKSSGQTVSEEEMFAALVEQGIADIGTDAKASFAEKQQKCREDLRRGDGFIPLEDAARQALDLVIEEGKITQEQGDKVFDESFRLAQLDSNLDTLWDSKGSEIDPTIAVKGLDEALDTVDKTSKALAAGEISLNAATSDSTSSSTSSATEASRQLDGAGGFLWKPVSESDGNLVVLLPQDLSADSISSVEVHKNTNFDSTSRLASGQFAGDDSNGGRAHYRFDSPGSEYGDNVYLVALMKDGSKVSYAINDGSKRND